MIKLDLITGFLGSGKTTFIKKYANYLLDQGKNIAILENDFGAVNVDMMLLKSLEEKECDLEMVAGGCDYDCHKRRFKTKLIALGMLGYDRVIIEPSGVFDVDEFFDVLHEEPINRWYEVGNVIAIVDEVATSKEARTLMASQISSAGMIVLSKLQGKDVTKITREIDELLEAFGSERNVSECVMAKEWDDWTEEDFEKILMSGSRSHDTTAAYVDKEAFFDSVYIMNIENTPEEILESIEEIFSNVDCGKVFRIKGFYQEGESWYQVNAMKNQIEVQPIKEGQNVIIMIGEKLKEEEIHKYFICKS